MKKYAICIGREFCSGGREIGKMLAKRLGIAYYDEIELRDRSRDLGIEDGIFEMFDEQPTRSFLFSVVMAQRKVIESATDEGPCVIVGRRADKILEGKEDVEVVSVFIGADMEDRIDRFMQSDEEDKPRNVRRYIEQKDRERSSYYNFLGDGKWGRAANYTMCFSTSKMDKEKICDIICNYVKEL